MSTSRTPSTVRQPRQTRSMSRARSPVPTPSSLGLNLGEEEQSPFINLDPERPFNPIDKGKGKDADEESHASGGTDLKDPFTTDISIIAKVADEDLDEEIEKEVNYRKEILRKRQLLATLRQEREERRTTKNKGSTSKDKAPVWRGGGGDGGDDDDEGGNEDDDEEDRPLNRDQQRNQAPEDAFLPLRTLRLSPPEKFKPPTKTSISEWLFKINLWFQASNIPDDAKVLQAALLLDGYALTWWMMLSRDHRQPRTWTQFEQQITTQFKTIDASVKARDQLDNLT